MVKPLDLNRHFVRLRAGRCIVWRGGVTDEWARTIARTARESSERRFILPGPNGAETFLKISRRRTQHGFLRRLRASRAIHEGLGYQAYREAGIQTTELFAFGEHRRFGLFERGFVATRRVDAPDVWTVMKEDPSLGILQRTAEVLANIHGRGLTHGDPLLRNFLATSPHPMPIDMGGFSPCDEGSRRLDLVRFIGSILMLTEDQSLATRCLDHYASVGSLILARQPLLEEAEAYARRKEHKERLREERRKGERRLRFAGPGFGSRREP